jgi:glycosyltransferase involved in cell wall biosynthesis
MPDGVEPSQKRANAQRRPRRALIVSSFVLPHVGGIEQFVALAAEDLRLAGWEVRLMASTALDGKPVAADIAIPTLHLFRSDYPLAYRGWLRVWKEVGAADLVIANQHRNLLPVVAVLMAAARRRAAVFVIHYGEGIPSYKRPWLNLLGRVFDKTLGRAALKRSVVATLSGSARQLVRRNWRLDARYVPFPIRLQSTLEPKRLKEGEPARAVWAGRLASQKDPILAVRAVDAARRKYDVVLEMFGDGPLRAELEEYVRDRPWCVLHGERSWDEVQASQAEAHFCLISSRNDATSLAALEPLSRGIPVVGTDVGDIGQHLGEDLALFATPPDNPEVLAEAIVCLCEEYDQYAPLFVENAARLKHHHGGGPDVLSALADELVPLGHSESASDANHPESVSVELGPPLGDSPQRN